MFEEDFKDWMHSQVDALTDTIEFISPSEWAEENRYLPPSVTPLSGFYDYSVAPYLREIVDNLDVRSPIRDISIKKGAQICATVGILENAIGYFMKVVKSAPVMMLTADAELAKLRMESYITPMIQQSNLADLIQSTDEIGGRKTGKTDTKIEWKGGGFLVPFGAKSASKLRSISIRVLLADEPDGYPDVVGCDGDPLDLAEDRTKAYSLTKKICRMSTPLIKGESRITAHYERGDQRKYMVPCKSCGEVQELRFQGVDKETGEVWGLEWKLNKDGNLDKKSVRYVCRYCGHKHRNSDKVWMLPRGHWKPTAIPVSDDIRSYHISALYSPSKMYPWADMVQKYIEAWDPKTNRVRDMRKLQRFYNNDLGEPFEVHGEGIKLESVSKHKRREYNYGEIPNKFALEATGGEIMLVVCTVDIQKDYLSVASFGWTAGARVFVIDYFNLEGNTENLADKCWLDLAEFIEEKEYIADDDKKYKIQMTLIDSGYRTDAVYAFCKNYKSSVFPSKGKHILGKSAKVNEFDMFQTKLGTEAYGITVDLYKEKWSAALRRGWDGIRLQSPGHFNAPWDATSKQLEELTKEEKKEKLDKTTKRRVGFEWYRPSGSKNELWDLLVYASAALDIIAWDICRRQLKLQYVNWPGFWQLCKDNNLFFKF